MYLKITKNALKKVTVIMEGTYWSYQSTEWRVAS